jgi:RNA polymerase sigma factor for flagellar operon FliA
MSQRIAELINQLPETEKQILVLLFHEKLNSQEIALVLGITIYEVIRLYSKAVIHLRINLRKLS